MRAFNTACLVLAFLLLVQVLMGSPWQLAYKTVAAALLLAWFFGMLVVIWRLRRR